MKLFKKISIFALAGFLGLTTFSCLNNDDEGSFTNYGFLTTNSVSVNQDSIQPINKTTNIKVSYNKTNSCQEFAQFSLIKQVNDSVQLVGVLASQTSSQSCLPTTSIETKTLKFTPKVARKYTLKFWTGKDSNNKDLYNDSIVLDIKSK
ncbi:hypothetical protein [Chishuiella sp.]|uniref:hypothetical protein n=1 Tax=Chishuiella sp. TaxID=1969467 RepID=UPI0028B0D88B|nr:hypothetical protein [Chishuiella sp.]